MTRAFSGTGRRTVSSQQQQHGPRLQLAADRVEHEARELEAAAPSDSRFIKGKLHPNVDFYSGILLRATGIPANMFTVIFAIGRMPDWIAHCQQVPDDPNGRIYRPRQIYVGATRRHYVPVEKRG